MEFKTTITDINNGDEIIRGYRLTDLIAKKSFADSIFLILRSRLPTPEESRMFDALLVAAIDHGVGTVSALTTRIVVSAKTSIQASVAAGILSMGERHGGAVGGAAQFFTDHLHDADIVSTLKACKEKKVRIPGYGHAVLTVDHRIEALFAVARDTGLYGAYAQFAETVGKNLSALSSKVLPLNVDGAMAALLLDMGFPVAGMTGLFIIARIPGLVAHAQEEMAGEAGLRRLEEENVIYEGEEGKIIE